MPQVARVCVDLALPHLDRLFDYAIPEAMMPQVHPGVRVRVRVAGRRVNGFVVEIAEQSEHQGRLIPLEAVVSPEPVLTPPLAALARTVADHYAGCMSDVLRLAIPARHAKVEKETASEGPAVASAVESVDLPQSANAAVVNPTSAVVWERLDGGVDALRHWQAGTAARVVSTVPPTAHPAAFIAAATAAVRGDAGEGVGPGVVIVVPDHRDVQRVLAELQDCGVTAAVEVLRADLGPAKRYRAWLRVRRGTARVVVGTRAAMFAPVLDPALLVVMDDGDDLHAEPRAPYPHVREVLAMRSQIDNCGLLVIGRMRTCEGQRLVSSGWATGIDPHREAVRAESPHMLTTGSDAEVARDPAGARSRLPSLALRTAQQAIATGPVLVQVPRAGYVPVLACQSCRSVSRCGACRGPLRLTSPTSAPVCGWCGSIRANHVCDQCGGASWRATRIGATRTAEELGRAMPGVQVVTSGRDGIVADLPKGNCLVVSTPGAEPIAPQGYSAVLLLDGDLLMSRQDLRADEEALRRWFNAAGLARTGAPVVIVADPSHRAVQALVRWDPVGFAGQEFDLRRSAHLVPAARMAAVDGEPPFVAEAVAAMELPSGTEVLGPVPLPPTQAGDPERVRIILRCPLTQGHALSVELHRMLAHRSARKDPGRVLVRIDPLTLG